MAARTTSRMRLSRAELLAAAAVLVATAFVVQPLMAQQASRMALTASLAEHGTVRIDRFEDGALGVDFARKDGHLYSDKAPAQPLLAVAPYLLYKAAGGESAEVLRVHHNLGLWWVSIWFAAVPAAVLTILMARLARPWSERWAVPAALAMAFGSLVLPFGTLLFSHTLSAALVVAALLAWRRRRAPWLAAAGASVGAAVAVEYTMIAALGVLGLASLLRDRWACRWTAAGAAVPLAALASYHWIAFGGPLEVPYRYHNLGLHDSAAAGLALPSPERLWTLATSGRGAFVLTPIVLLAAIGLVNAARDRPERRPEIATISGLFVAFFVIQAGAADLTGGASLGPRYLLPGVPALVVGLAALWERRPTLCNSVAVVSALVMVLATFTNPLVRVDEDQIMGYWLDRLRAGEVADTLLAPLIGRSSGIVILVAAGMLVAAAVRAAPARDTP